MPPDAMQVEMWTLRKDARTLKCVAVHLPAGIDVRVFEDDELRRTQLVKDLGHAEALAFALHVRAEAIGWAGSG